MLNKLLSKHDNTIVLAYSLGFRFDFETQEIIRPSGHRRKIDKVYGKQRYPFDGFTHEGESFSFKVHRFCAYLKYGDKLFEKGTLVRHLDDNPLNLAWDNIALGTPKDNSLDQCEADRKKRAKHARSFQKRPPRCNISDEYAEEIIKELFNVTSGLEKRKWGLNTMLAKKFGVPRHSIEDIVYGKSFKDIYEKVFKEFYNV